MEETPRPRRFFSPAIIIICAFVCNVLFCGLYLISPRNHTVWFNGYSEKIFNSIKIGDDATGALLKLGSRSLDINISEDKYRSIFTFPNDDYNPEHFCMREIIIDKKNNKILNIISKNNWNINKFDLIFLMPYPYNRRRISF